MSDEDLLSAENALLLLYTFLPYFDLELLNLIADIPVLGELVKKIPEVEGSENNVDRAINVLLLADEVIAIIVSGGLLGLLPILDRETLRLISNVFEAITGLDIAEKIPVIGSAGGGSGAVEIEAVEENPVAGKELGTVTLVGRASSDQYGDWSLKHGDINVGHVYKYTTGEGREIYLNFNERGNRIIPQQSTLTELRELGLMPESLGGKSSSASYSGAGTEPTGSGAGGGDDSGGIPLSLPSGKTAVIILGVLLLLFLGIVIGPVGEYLGFGGEAVADRAAVVAASSGAEQAYGTFRQAKARVFCVMKGPSCLRQWRLNNTKRPGSDEVGQNYGLSIDRFEVGQAKKLDIAYKEQGYAIPMSFTISNNRHGLKGIDAINVSYRVRFIDSERGVDNPYCDSGWIPVNGFDIEKGDDMWESNDIYPGTSASTAFLTLTGKVNEKNSVSVKDDFTLRGCEMLQPALGEYRKVRLDVKYNYFSRATLYFRAMSLQNLQSNPDIRKEFKNSETADTPVKAAISVNEPVLYDEDEVGTGDAAQPFGVRATLNTDEYNIRYKVRELVIEKSDGVEKAKDVSQECQFIENPGDPIGKVPIDKRIGEKRWFDTSAEPPIFGCVMELSDPGTISPTGETLTMGVKSNYTVSVDENIESFNVLNSQCGSAYNCPVLATVSEDQNDAGYDWKTRCEGVDAGNGCTIAEINTNLDDPPFGDIISIGKVAGGDTAYKFSELISRWNRPKAYVNNTAVNPSRDAVGLREDKVEEDGGKAIVRLKYGSRKDIVLRNLEFKVCDQSTGLMTQIAGNWSKENSYNVYYFGPETMDCTGTQSILDIIADWLSGGSDPCGSETDEIGAIIVRNGQPECW